MTNFLFSLIICNIFVLHLLLNLSDVRWVFRKPKFCPVFNWLNCQFLLIKFCFLREARCWWISDLGLLARVDDSACWRRWCWNRGWRIITIGTRISVWALLRTTFARYYSIFDLLALFCTLRVHFDRLYIIIILNFIFVLF